MSAIVLLSSLGSQYEDTPTSYEFPARYLKYFAHAGPDPLFAVFYEPRGKDLRGRMKYVGWAELAGAPTLAARAQVTGEPRYVAHFKEPAHPFEVPVPREVMGEPVERWLGAFARGRPRNVQTYGTSVRRLADEDFARIMELSGAPLIELKSEPTDIRERVAILSNRLRRDDQFRREVISSYGRRCAVSGFTLGPVSVSKAQGLLDAAHIRPVQDNGPDRVSNGLPLTPTLHRMFDAGLFSAEYLNGVPRLVVSPRLEQTMIESPDSSSRLDLREGRPLLLPKATDQWPDRRQLEYHREHVFLSG